jgi:hypothetical protein
LEARIGKARDHAFKLLARRGIAGQIDCALLRHDHAGGTGDFAVDESSALLRQRGDLPLLVRQRVRTELDHDLPQPSTVDETLRTLHHVIERLHRWQAREYDVGLRAHISCRLRRHAADFFEFGERAAAIADDTPTALDEVLRDRHTDLTNAYKTDGLHAASHTLIRPPND